jgi:putative tricarboxylic transport membrane protein
VLGPLIEENLRRALIISHGNPTVFFTRPISAASLIVTAVFLLMFVVPMFRKKRAEVLAEEGS